MNFRIALYKISLLIRVPGGEERRAGLGRTGPSGRNEGNDVSATYAYKPDAGHSVQETFLSIPTHALIMCHAVARPARDFHYLYTYALFFSLRSKNSITLKIMASTSGASDSMTH